MGISTVGYNLKKVKIEPEDIEGVAFLGTTGTTLHDIIDGHTESGLTTGQIFTAASATTFEWSNNVDISGDITTAGGDVNLTNTTNNLIKAYGDAAYRSLDIDALDIDLKISNTNVLQVQSTGIFVIGDISVNGSNLNMTNTTNNVIYAYGSTAYRNLDINALTIDMKISNSDVLQIGAAGVTVTGDIVVDGNVDGIDVSDHDADVTTKHLADQSGHNAQYLKSNGTVADWAAGGATTPHALIDLVNHPEAGLTIGHVVRATSGGSPSSYEFAALIEDDLPSHDIITKHSESGLTTGQIIAATGATTFEWVTDWDSPGFVDAHTGFKVAGTEVIDSSRNFKNIADISQSTLTQTSVGSTSFFIVSERNTASGAYLYLSHQRSGSAAGQDNDLPGRVVFRGFNDAGTPQEVLYGTIACKILDASDGTEDSELAFNVFKNGVNTETLIIDSSGIAVTGAIAVTSTVDGRDIASDGTKLDGIAAGAQPGTVTAVTGSAPVTSSGGNTPSISMAEANGGSAGHMSVAHHDKLDGIEGGANITDTANVTAAMTDGAHGSRGNGNLHTIVTTVVNGFMSSAGKVKLNGIDDNADVTDTANVTSAMTDGAHGNRGGGDLHSLVTTTVHGFMASGDKVKLNGIDGNADVTGDNPPQAHTLASHSTKPHSALTSVSANQHHAQSHDNTYHSTNYATDANFINHSARHQNAGADEISVSALSGELADPQTPKAHVLISAAGHTLAAGATGDIMMITNVAPYAYNFVSAIDITGNIHSGGHVSVDSGNLIRLTGVGGTTVLKYEAGEVVIKRGGALKLQIGSATTTLTNDVTITGVCRANGGFRDGAIIGVDGSFETDANYNITVSGGIITNIAAG